MTITGKYNTDQNFINVFTEDKLYTIPRNARSNWSYITVGDRTSQGVIFDMETFKKLKAECTEEDTFELD